MDVEADHIDNLGMVVDFGDVRDIVKGWIDSELDHRMLLYSNDPIVPVLIEMGEPVYVMDSNPTAEAISKLIFDHAHKKKLNVSEVRLWETASSFATYRNS